MKLGFYIYWYSLSFPCSLVKAIEPMDKIYITKAYEPPPSIHSELLSVWDAPKDSSPDILVAWLTKAINRPPEPFDFFYVGQMFYEAQMFEHACAYLGEYVARWGKGSQGVEPIGWHLYAHSLYHLKRYHEAFHAFRHTANNGFDEDWQLLLDCKLMAVDARLAAKALKEAPSIPLPTEAALARERARLRGIVKPNVAPVVDEALLRADRPSPRRQRPSPDGATATNITSNTDTAEGHSRPSTSGDSPAVSTHGELSLPSLGAAVSAAAQPSHTLYRHVLPADPDPDTPADTHPALTHLLPAMPTAAGSAAVPVGVVRFQRWQPPSAPEPAPRLFCPSHVSITINPYSCPSRAEAPLPRSATSAYASRSPIPDAYVRTRLSRVYDPTTRSHRPARPPAAAPVPSPQRLPPRPLEPDTAPIPSYLPAPGAGWPVGAQEVPPLPAIAPIRHNAVTAALLAATQAAEPVAGMGMGMGGRSSDRGTVTLHGVGGRSMPVPSPVAAVPAVAWTDAHTTNTTTTTSPTTAASGASTPASTSPSTVVSASTSTVESLPSHELVRVSSLAQPVPVPQLQPQSSVGTHSTTGPRDSPVTPSFTPTQPPPSATVSGTPTRTPRAPPGAPSPAVPRSRAVRLVLNKSETTPQRSGNVSVRVRVSDRQVAGPASTSKGINPQEEETRIAWGTQELVDE